MNARARRRYRRRMERVRWVAPLPSLEDWYHHEMQFTWFRSDDVVHFVDGTALYVPPAPRPPRIPGFRSWAPGYFFPDDLAGLEPEWAEPDKLDLGVVRDATTEGRPDTEFFLERSETPEWFPRPPDPPGVAR